MCARMREVQTQVAERDELIEVIAIALLTRKNVFVLGDTGQAKSAVINLFRDGLTGARQFERLMSKPVSYTHLDVYKRQHFVSQCLIHRVIPPFRFYRSQTRSLPGVADSIASEIGTPALSRARRPASSMMKLPER